MGAVGDEIRITGIHLYPLKSAAAFSVHEAAVDRIGLAGDRRWMLIDSAARALTQREVPRLARIHAVPSIDGSLEVVALGMPPLRVAVPSAEAGLIESVVHNRSARGVPTGKRPEAWFSEFLEVGCRLLYLPPEPGIAVAAPWGSAGDSTAFTDGFPILVIGEGSLDELNRRLAEPVPMDRFRPNLVVGGTAPFAEDSWDTIGIGPLRLKAVKPCPRCVITTVDQVTGVPDPSGEPLATLAGFRKRDGKVWFGMNLLHEGIGRIQLGDEVRVITKRERSG